MLKVYFMSVAFMFALAYPAHADADCGVSGTISERIKNCAKSITTAEAVIWHLVAHWEVPSRSYEIWQDAATGLIWSDTLDTRYTHQDAIELDKTTVGNYYTNCWKSPSKQWIDCRVNSESACTSNAGEQATGGITERAFGLPTEGDYMWATLHGIKEIFPKSSHRKRWYWTASISPSYDRHAVSANIYSGAGLYEDKYNTLRVRCVGR